MEKLLPQNIEAECGVLGSIIIDPEAIVQIADFLTAEDFYRDAHRTIYETIIQLYEQHEPADFITICDELERKNKLEEVGGASYVTSLINQVPTSGNVEYYGRIVERTATLRRLIHAAGEIAAAAYEEGDAEVALDKAEKLIFAISQHHTRSDFSGLRDLMSDYMNKLDQLHERRGTIVGVPTGFTDLDRLTGGLQKSDLLILAARPAVGKCLPGWTLLDHPTSGARLTLSEYVQQRIPDVYGLSSDGKVRVTSISDWVDSGIKLCYRVETELGRMVEVTGHHPFLTEQGWEPLYNLHVGDRIAVPTRVAAFGQDNHLPLTEITNIARQLLAAALTVEDAAFPAEAWTWSQSHLATFLKTLLEKQQTDSENNDKQHSIEFASRSQQLGRDLQHALTRFGIIARIYQKKRQTSDRSIISHWHVAITHPESIQRYQEEICQINTQKPQKIDRSAEKETQQQQYQSSRTSGIGILEKEAVEQIELKNENSTDIYWDRIVSLAAIGEHQVYDLSVPDGANFIAQDVCVHNTSFCLSLAHNAAVKHNQSIAIFSLEMSKEQLVQRLLSMDAGIDQQRLRTGWIEDEEWERIVYSMGTLAEANIWIDDTAGISTMEMRSKARRLKAQHGIDMIIVDYLQLMQGSAGGKRNENRVQEISEISRNLKGLARELNVPVMALAQLSRAVESRTSKIPQLSDLRESGCLSGETLIYLPDNKSWQRIDSLSGTNGFNVLALNPTSRSLEPKKVTHAFSTGTKAVWKMTTAPGYSIRATANHRFLTQDGWQPLANITPGTLIALPCTNTGTICTQESEGSASEEMARYNAPLQNRATQKQRWGGDESINRGGSAVAYAVQASPEQDVYWDEVTTIEADGEEAVYDLTVEDHHNFIANNIIVHNSIEQDADVVMFIYREDVYNPDTERKNIADIIIAKHRNGPIGEVSLYFQASQTRFHDLEVTEPADEE